MMDPTTIMQRRVIWVVFLGFVVAGVLSGCLYADVTVPLAWVSNTRLDVKDLNLDEREITGESTARSILFGLIMWGDAGVDAALRNAKRTAGFQIQEVYDVRTDQHIFNFLGLYFSRTIIVTAKVAQ